MSIRGRGFVLDSGFGDLGFVVLVRERLGCWIHVFDGAASAVLLGRLFKISCSHCGKPHERGLLEISLDGTNASSEP